VAAWNGAGPLNEVAERGRFWRAGRTAPAGALRGEVLASQAGFTGRGRAAAGRFCPAPSFPAPAG